MKLINSIGPNPRVVRLFIAEKGLQIPFGSVDLWGGENRKEEYKKKNPGGTIPTLVLDDGKYLAESVAICEYLEELHPAPPLVGTTPWERAQTHEALRRVEIQCTENLYNAFRYGPALETFKDRFRCIPEAHEGLKAKGLDGVVLMNTLLVGREFLVGERLTLADLVLYSALDFTSSWGVTYDPALTHVHAWLARMSKRPSALSSLSPDWEKVGIRA